LHLCEKAGLVKLGHVALDGPEIQANASKHKAMSYARTEDRAAELEAEVAKWLSMAEAADAEEDIVCTARNLLKLAPPVGGRRFRVEPIPETPRAIKLCERLAHGLVHRLPSVTRSRSPPPI
jgi:hypothetical protein